MGVGRRDPELGRVLISDRRQQIDEGHVLGIGEAMDQIGDVLQPIMLDVVQLRPADDDQLAPLLSRRFCQFMNGCLRRVPAGRVVKTKIVFVPALLSAEAAQEAIHATEEDDEKL